MMEPYANHIHETKTDWLYRGIVFTDYQISVLQLTDENKRHEFQTAYVAIGPTNILILEKLKPKGHGSFLDTLSREKRLLCFLSCQCGALGKRGGGGV